MSRPVASISASTCATASAAVRLFASLEKQLKLDGISAGIAIVAADESGMYFSLKCTFADSNNGAQWSTLDR